MIVALRSDLSILMRYNAQAAAGLYIEGTLHNMMASPPKDGSVLVQEQEWSSKLVTCSIGCH